MGRGLRFLTAALLAGCAGCFSLGTPDARAWLVVPRADLQRNSAPEGGGSAFAATRLGMVNVCAPYDRAPFVVRRADGSVAFDAYNVFASAPALLLRAPVSGRLLADGRFGHVVAQSSSAAADAQVEVMVTDLSLDCRDGSRRTARAAVSLDVVKCGRGPRDVVMVGVGAGEADASSGDYSAAFSAAFDAAVAEALRSLK
jgi:uncharacterized lipoprotein YmbA